MLENKNENLIFLLIGLLIFIAFSFFLFGGIFQSLDNKSYDLLLKIRGERALSDKIIIVSIDDASLKYLGKKWPLSRKMLIDAVNNIADYAPKVIGMDILLSNKGNKVEDLYFAEKLKNINSKTPVVLAMGFSSERETQFIKNTNIKLYQESLEKPFFKGTYGFVNVSFDEDHILRKFQLIKKHHTGTYFFFVLKIIEKYFYLDLTKMIFEPGDSIKIPNYGEIPLDNNNSAFINYRGPPGSIKKISFFQVYENRDIPEHLFKNKIVLLGTESHFINDFYFTPFSFYQDVRAQMSGIEILSNIAETLLQKKFIIKVPNSIHWVILFLITFIMILFTILRKNIIKIFLIYLGAGILLIFLSVFLFIHTLLLFNFFIPLMNIIIIFILFYITQKVIKKVTKEQGEGINVDAFYKKYDISNREKDIILFILKDFTIKQIGKKLYISGSTVKKHIYNIYQKTKVKTRAEFFNIINKYKDQ